MPSLVDAMNACLEPHVGALVAKICTEGAAREAGKPPTALSESDLTVVEEDLRERLSLVLTEPEIEEIISELEMRVLTV